VSRERRARPGAQKPGISKMPGFSMVSSECAPDLARARTAGQNESELTTSAPLVVEMARQMFSAIEFLMNFTEPSANPAFTPPGCLLRAVLNSGNVVVGAVQGGLVWYG
jgi:hypothetical protein